MAKPIGNIWHFPVSGGKVECEGETCKLLPPPTGSIHDAELAIVPCLPMRQGSMRSFARYFP